MLFIAKQSKVNCNIRTLRVKHFNSKCARKILPFGCKCLLTPSLLVVSADSDFTQRNFFGYAITSAGRKYCIGEIQLFANRIDSLIIARNTELIENGLSALNRTIRTRRPVFQAGIRSI